MYVVLCLGLGFDSIKQCVFLCQCYAVFITIAQQQSSSSKMVTPPEVLLFTRLFQISWGFCFFLYEVRCCSFKVCENCVRILMRIVLNMLIAFGKMVIFTILFMRHSVMWGVSLISEEVCLCSRVTSGCKHLGEVTVAGACTHIDQSSRNAHTWSLPLL